MLPTDLVIRLAADPDFVRLCVWPPVASRVVPVPGTKPSAFVAVDVGTADGPSVRITVTTDSAPRAPSTGSLGPEVPFPLGPADEHSRVVLLAICGGMRVPIAEFLRELPGLAPELAKLLAPVKEVTCGKELLQMIRGELRNDFMVVGPRRNPVGARNLAKISEAVQKAARADMNAHWADWEVTRLRADVVHVRGNCVELNRKVDTFSSRSSPFCRPVALPVALVSNYRTILVVTSPVARRYLRRCSFSFPVLPCSYTLWRPVSLPVALVSTSNTILAVPRHVARNPSPRCGCRLPVFSVPLRFLPRYHRV